MNFSTRMFRDEVLTNSWEHALHIIKLVVDAAHLTLSKITVAIHSAFFDVNLRRIFEDRIHPEHWIRLEETLEPLDLERLTRVRVRIGELTELSPFKPGSMSARVTRSFPRTHARGILEIC